MYVCFVQEILDHNYMLFLSQNLEVTTIVLLPRASHPDTQMTEVISLRSNRAKDCPGKSNSFPQKFAKILTFTGVIYDFIQSISEYADAIWRVLTWFGDESTTLYQTEVSSLRSWYQFNKWGKTLPVSGKSNSFPQRFFKFLYITINSIIEEQFQLWNLL